ncbi:fumarylacetoacetate hydrolase family protein [Sphingomonas flavalba]|uniref:fumarylacetoacetate hydrolase family protein n=1 Tax=Sphingomonas flavalba TaxID=2559804 RepID=UPI00109D8DBA|nr:fumarylacetoacetate hydrolase family protein [Sphingomonas flavalba]
MRNRDLLPVDLHRALLVGRLWLDGAPRLIAVRAGEVIDIGALAPTMSDLLDLDDPAAAVRAVRGTPIGAIDEILENSTPGWAAAGPFLLAPCDLQAIKAAGVTFVSSMIERVVEERAGGDAAQAEQFRAALVSELGSELRAIRPGSPEAARAKALLTERGLWSQYLEVGLGPDAEIFSKAQPMSAVGFGAYIGIHPRSRWNNPEPEVVLAVSSRGQVVGATLGNDVNLRDFEGRSALLLSRAKDNNASCAIGPFIRLFDDGFGLDDVRAADLTLTVDGRDGFRLAGESSMRQISRDPLDLVAQTIEYHHFPDGFVLFCGTLFAPTQDRDTPGGGFTHKIGDVVEIRSPLLGTLRNTVTTSDLAPPWTFGTRALIASLAGRANP